MKSRNRKGVFSVICCCIAVWWSGAIAFGYPGVMTPYWQEAFGVGSAATGLVVTFMLLALAICMFISGKVNAKYGMRVCVTCGLVFSVLAMIILLNAKNIYTVYVWAFVNNVGLSFMFGPGTAICQQWFPNRRGLVTGVLNMVFGGSAAVMSPIWNNMLANMGYRKLNIILLIMIVITDLIALIACEGPSRTKLTPEEKKAHEELLASCAGKGKKGGMVANYTLKEALSTKCFWLIWLSWVFMGAAGISMVSLSKSYSIAIGITGAIVLTSFNIANGVGRIICGILCDAIGPAWTGVIAFVICAGGYLALPHVSGVAGVAICAICVGYGLANLFATTPSLASGIFGLKNFGTIFGVIWTAYGFIGGVVGPMIAGLVLDRTGNNYSMVFTYLAVFAVIGAVLYFILTKATVKEREKKLAEIAAAGGNKAA